MCPKSLNGLLPSRSNTLAAWQDGICDQSLGLSPQIDSDRLAYLMNLLSTLYLSNELMTGKVVVIGEPGNKDMSNPKSYRCKITP
jgi:hypothetical protein